MEYREEGHHVKKSGEWVSIYVFMGSRRPLLVSGESLFRSRHFRKVGEITGMFMERCQ